MRGKTRALPLILPSIGLSFLSVSLYLDVAGGSAAVATSFLVSLGGVVLSLGIIVHDKWKMLYGIIALVMLLCLLMGIAVKRHNSLHLCFPKDSIVGFDGVVLYDSSFTQSGNHLMKIWVRGCTTGHGDEGRCKGVLTVVGGETALVSLGIKVKLKGQFRDGIFLYDELQVTDRSVMNDMREDLVQRLQGRLLGEEPDKGTLLSVQLLLGRADEGSLGVKEKAVECGCAHVLALSGMHLGVLAALCLKLPFGKHLPRILAHVLVVLFLIIAGPRASLVRAALVFFLARIPIRWRAIAVFIVQMLFFPWTMVELGCCYGYLAFFALAHLAPAIDGVLSQYMGRLGSYLSPSIAVLIYSVPFQMAMNGAWSPAVILVSPLLTALAAVSMTIGLLILVFGRLVPLVWSANMVYGAMEHIMDLFGRIPKAGWVGYGVLVLLVTAVFALNRLDRYTFLKGGLL